MKTSIRVFTAINFLGYVISAMLFLALKPFAITNNGSVFVLAVALAAPFLLSMVVSFRFLGQRIDRATSVASAIFFGIVVALIGLILTSIYAGLSVALGIVSSSGALKEISYTSLVFVWGTALCGLLGIITSGAFSGWYLYRSKQLVKTKSALQE